MKLYVDDERPCPEGWTVARTYDEALFCLILYNITDLSLDHDLGWGRTGYDLLRELSEMYAYGRAFIPEHIYCHSANPVGRKHIEQLIERIQERRT